eukprot:m.738974 g.738974  ORF g.738974 m.738974 type:complete len:51 (-) comp58917_c0_seq2:8-160(-)
MCRSTTSFGRRDLRRFGNIPCSLFNSSPLTNARFSLDYLTLLDQVDYGTV